MIKRDFYLDRLIHNMWNGEIKVITGICCCGKSVLLFDLFYEYLLSQKSNKSPVVLKSPGHSKRFINKYVKHT